MYHRNSTHFPNPVYPRNRHVCRKGGRAEGRTETTVRPSDSPTYRPIWLVTSATGPHPFPSRTRQLSLSASMVLRGIPRGRVDRCQPFVYGRFFRPLTPSPLGGGVLRVVCPAWAVVRG